MEVHGFALPRREFGAVDTYIRQRRCDWRGNWDDDTDYLNPHRYDIVVAVGAEGFLFRGKRADRKLQRPGPRTRDSAGRYEKEVAARIDSMPPAQLPVHEWDEPPEKEIQARLQAASTHSQWELDDDTEFMEEDARGMSLVFNYKTKLYGPRR